MVRSECRASTKYRFTNSLTARRTAHSMALLISFANDRSRRVADQATHQAFAGLTDTLALFLARFLSWLPTSVYQVNLYFINLVFYWLPIVAKTPVIKAVEARAVFLWVGGKTAAFSLAFSTNWRCCSLFSWFGPRIRSPQIGQRGWRGIFFPLASLIIASYCGYRGLTHQ